jgi:RHS repeat-associated protein
MSGASNVAQYKYDGFKRRIISGVGVSTTDRHHYYSENWQVLEERVGAATTAERQFVWGIRYIDDLVLRDQGFTRLYALQDANWNVVAITNAASPTVVQERYAYEAYGKAKVLDASFNNRASTSFTWETRYAGYRWDVLSSLFHVRHRDWNISFWVRRDPITYVDDMNLYSGFRSNPTGHNDPFGTVTILVPRLFPRLCTPTLPRGPLPLQMGPPLPAEPKPQPVPKPKRGDPCPYDKITNPETGDCGKNQLARLNEEVDKYCPSGTCKTMLYMSCQTIKNMVDSIQKCYDARKKREFTCFRGGDIGHQIQYLQEEDKLNYCWWLYRRKDCASNDFPALNQMADCDTSFPIIS